MNFFSMKISDDCFIFAQVSKFQMTVLFLRKFLNLEKKSAII